jgi:hypothetical protein
MGLLYGSERRDTGKRLKTFIFFISLQFYELEFPYMSRLSENLGVWLISSQVPRRNFRWESGSGFD